MHEDFPETTDSPNFPGPEGLDVEPYWAGRVMVLAVSGCVDMVTSGQLSDAIGVAAAQAPVGIVVDLSKTDFLASTGMSVLIQAHAEVTSTGQFGVVADGPATSRPMKLLGLDKVLGLYRTLGEALAEMNGE
jgi:anti-anti-sigma factor